MTRRRWTPVLAPPALLGVLWGVSGCNPPSSPAAPPKTAAPAKVESPAKEADLATIKLTAEAEKRLGLGLVPAARAPVPRTVIYGGEVTIPFGQLISVASPFIGTLKAPEGAPMPRPGQPVKEGQPLFVLIPILSPEARATMAPLLIDAEGQVRQATDQLKIAKVALDRAENLLRDKLGGTAALVDAKAQYELAQTNLKTAQNRREILAKVASDVDSGSINVQTITAPASGVLQNVHAMVGQKVAAGALLFDVENLDPVWIKVPVYVGDLERIAPDRDASVGGLSDAPGAAVRNAKPVAAPPSGDPLAGSVNVYYEVANKDGAFRPGQRVGMTLPLKGDEESLTVPRASLLRDIHGGTWVYEKVGDHAYARRRVMVDRVVGDVVALVSGPKEGKEVVTTGAAELFGVEFGGAK